MPVAEQLITDHLDTWSSTVKPKSSAGRGKSNGKQELYGIKKLRELILELAVRGLLVPQDPNDEPASELLKRIIDEKAKLVRDGKIKKQKKLPPIETDVETQTPIGWTRSRLGNLVNLISGQHLKGNEYFDSEVESSIPYLTGPAEFGEKYPTPTRYTRERRSVASTDDILITCKGSGVGKLNYADREIFISRQLMAIQPVVISSDFLMLLAKSLNSHFRANIVGIAIPGISREDVLEAVISLPPLAEQHRIVAKVDELMVLCDQLEGQQANHLEAHQTLVQTLLSALTASSDATAFTAAWTRIQANFDTLFTTESSIDQLKQTILQLSVMGKLVPQDPNDEPASELLKKIATEKAALIKSCKIKKQRKLPALASEEKRHDIPHEWIWCRLTDAYDVRDCPISRKTGIFFGSHALC
ncbi:restriction endonuclease subunit S [Pelagicoccus sp. NFK12]|uniref:Restriction endonuclease subunit S n=1 Tax=Pelagicoccus enzymogenes TaxID=2773457 RepID=A0A927F7H2_9BACT|nr:restriction endonuclease subunit S [Pelagicoccus enzymogenes]MBD5779873.1 restriction endonuclease subunit S [Pelagicoccus enzymogenes]